MKPNNPSDPSVDYIRYPTFAHLPHPLPLTRPQYRCTGCSGADFGLLMPQRRLLCRACGLEQDLPPAPSCARTVTS